MIRPRLLLVPPIVVTSARKVVPKKRGWRDGLRERGNNEERCWNTGQNSGFLGPRGFQFELERGSLERLVNFEVQ